MAGPGEAFEFGVRNVGFGSAGVVCADAKVVRAASVVMMVVVKCILTVFLDVMIWFGGSMVCSSECGVMEGMVEKNKLSEVCTC